MTSFIKTSLSRHTRITLIIAIAAAFPFSGEAREQASSIAPEKVKNVIYLIGDGMGISQVTAASTFQGTPLFMEGCSIVGLARTHAHNAYVTDSAAAGTALACGVKTNNGVIGLDPEGKPVRSILSYAKESGKSTGLVVTSSITHATPAVFVAHQMHRKMEEEIAGDYLVAQPDVAIGGGKKFFENRSDGRNISAELRKKGYQIAYTLEEFTAASSGRWIGLLADVGLPRASEGSARMLERSVSTALKLLNQNKAGFVLMVEGSKIDSGGHRNDLNYAVEELIDFDRAVKVAFDFAETDGNTLVVVTADHETGGLSLIKGDRAEKSVEPGWATKGHSAVMVPVFAHGAGAGAFSGVYENTDIFHRMMKLLDLKAEPSLEKTKQLEAKPVAQKVSAQ